MKKISKALLKKTLCNDHNANWFVHSQGFHEAGLKLAEVSQIILPEKMMSQKEIFVNRYICKVAVYLLAHSIELLLKSIISIHNNIVSKQEPLKPPMKYSHHVVKMVEDLRAANVFAVSESDMKLFQMIDEYLKWFGRYYCPQEKDLDAVIASAYTAPDNDGFVSFRYEIKYPETHQRLHKLYKEYEPKSDEASLQMVYLLNCP